jgi:hypothetical protein
VKVSEGRLKLWIVAGWWYMRLPNGVDWRLGTVARDSVQRTVRYGLMVIREGWQR